MPPTPAASAQAAATAATNAALKAKTKKRQQQSQQIAAVGAQKPNVTQPARSDPPSRSPRCRPATVDLSQCHNESLDLVRLIISLNPQYLCESRHRLNHAAMVDGSGGVYYERLASLLWTGRAAARSLENFSRLSARLGSVQTNHFPSIDDMCTKAALARKLNWCARVYGREEYGFFPRTWVIPQEWDALRAEVVANAAAAATTASANAAATAASAAAATAASAAAATAGAVAAAAVSTSTTAAASSTAAAATAAKSSPVSTATANATAATPAPSTTAAAPAPPAPAPAPAATPAAPPTTFIFKPSTGSQGAGIMLAQRLNDMDKIVRVAGENGVALTVQEYISKPLLLGGLKFDFRIYVLLESLEPLRFHLYRDGLARFCTEAYQAPNARNLTQFYRHLTNSSLNKANEDKFKIHATADLSDAERDVLNRELIRTSGVGGASPAAGDASPQESKESFLSVDGGGGGGGGGVGGLASKLPPGVEPSELNLASLSLALDLHEAESSKRSIRTVLSQLRAEGHPLQDRDFWNSIADIVRKTLMSLWAPSFANYRVAFPGHRPSPQFPSACFHILGFDVMLDSALQPWLLELNASPSLNVDSTLDLVLKKGVVEKALGILGYLGEERRRKRKGATAAAAAGGAGQANEGSGPSSRASPVPSEPATAAVATTATSTNGTTSTPASTMSSASASPSSSSRFPPISISVQAASCSPATTSSATPIPSPHNHNHSRSRPSSSSGLAPRSHSAAASPVPMGATLLGYPVPSSGSGAGVSFSASTPGSGSSTPLPFFTIHAQNGKQRHSTDSPLTLGGGGGAGSGVGASTLPHPVALHPGVLLPYAQPGQGQMAPPALPFVPVIPAYNKRRSASSGGGAIGTGGGSSSGAGGTAALGTASPHAQRRYVLIPGGGVQALDAEGRVIQVLGNRAPSPLIPSTAAAPAAGAAAAPTATTTTSGTPSPASDSAAVVVSKGGVASTATLEEQAALADYMELCPEDEFAASGGAACYPPFSGLASTPVHPLLLFQHPKLLAVFDRYTGGIGGAKRMTGNKFLQACVACRIAGGTGGSGAAAATAAATAVATAVTTAAAAASASAAAAAAAGFTAGSSSNGAPGKPAASPAAPSSSSSSAGTAASPAPRPLSHWPTRPDIDLLFLQHTRFAEGAGPGGLGAGLGISAASAAAGGGGGGGAGGRHGAGAALVAKTLDYAGFCDVLFAVAEVKYKHLLAAPGSAPHPTVGAALAAASMTPAQAFLHFVDNIKLPEDMNVTAAAGATTTTAMTTGATSTTATAAAVGAGAGATASSNGAVSRSDSTLTAPPRRPVALHQSPPTTRSESPAIGRSSTLNGGGGIASSPVVSRSALAATLTQLLAPKDPSASVFSRLQGASPGAGAAPSATASLKQKRRQREQQAGSYEAFLAAHQASKMAKAKTNKK